ncbi:MAG: glutathione S-transferase [Parvibaculum sp.]
MTRGYSLYGAEVSYFTGKVRAYLRYKRIPFAEYVADRKAYMDVILPRVGWPVIPVVITPEDETLQDSSDIIDELERRFPEAPVMPSMPRQRLAALMLEVYGDEWLKIPAMHYRWTKNRDWAIGEFGALTLPAASKDEQRAAGEVIARPFAGALPALGITPANGHAIEKSYEGLLHDLNVHFGKYEFLLGSRPSIGDFGLIGPLYAHQYRDPASGEIMKAQAPHVVRWVKNMMRPPHPKGGEFLAGDEIPETLKPVLARFAHEMIPVLVSTARRLREWQAENPQGRDGAGEMPRALGMHDFSLEGVTEKRAIFPFELWMLQRPLDALASFEGQGLKSAEALLHDIGADTLAAFPAFPRLTRRHFKLVFA